ncbi:MAG: formylglycine-generating enzyme family protein [Waterburya sp.]
MTRTFYFRLFMGKFPITQAQWQTVMGNNPARFQDSPLNPVEGVSWDDAQEFCDRLSKLTEKEFDTIMALCFFALLPSASKKSYLVHKNQ